MPFLRMRNHLGIRLGECEDSMNSELAQLFKAASEPVRLEILQLLRGGTLCVCDLQAQLGLPQPTVSRHLAALRHTGLVRDRREGPRMLYSLAPAETDLRTAFLHFLARACEMDPALRRGPGARRTRWRSPGRTQAQAAPAGRVPGKRRNRSRSANR